MKPWRGVWPATKPGSKCLQYGAITRAGLASIEGDEDCLYLNVYSPLVCAGHSSILSIVHVGVCICEFATVGVRHHSAARPRVVDGGTASLRIYCMSGRGQTMRGGPPALGLGIGLTALRLKKINVL
jgi:hypothetical protein